MHYHFTRARARADYEKKRDIEESELALA